MMARSAFARAIIACCVVIATSSVVRAQSAADRSLYGKVTHKSDGATRAGDRVLAYDIDGSKKWLGPALTDDNGAYAFYNLAPGPYLLRVYVNGRSVWNNQVTVTASATRYDIAVDQ